MLHSHHKNSIITGVVDAFCLLCETHLKTHHEIKSHISDSLHQEKINSVSYFEKYEKEHIRKVKSGYYCEFCNVFFTTLGKVKLHLQNNTHNHNKGSQLLKRTNGGKIIMAQGDLHIDERAWSGLVDETCIICNMELEDESAHINSSSHIINMIQSKIEFRDGTVYRILDDDSFQCLTCNYEFALNTLSTHSQTSDHISKIEVSEKSKENDEVQLPIANTDIVIRHTELNSKVEKEDLHNLKMFREQKLQLVTGLKKKNKEFVVNTMAKMNDLSELVKEEPVENVKATKVTFDTNIEQKQEKINANKILKKDEIINDVVVENIQVNKGYFTYEEKLFENKMVKKDEIKEEFTSNKNAKKDEILKGEVLQIKEINNGEINKEGIVVNKRVKEINIKREVLVINKQVHKSEIKNREILANKIEIKEKLVKNKQVNKVETKVKLIEKEKVNKGEVEKVADKKTIKDVILNREIVENKQFNDGEIKNKEFVANKKVIKDKIIKEDIVKNEKIKEDEIIKEILVKSMHVNKDGIEKEELIANEKVTSDKLIANKKSKSDEMKKELVNKNINKEEIIKEELVAKKKAMNEELIVNKNSKKVEIKEELVLNEKSKEDETVMEVYYGNKKAKQKDVQKTLLTKKQDINDEFLTQCPLENETKTADILCTMDHDTIEFKICNEIASIDYIARHEIGFICVLCEWILEAHEIKLHSLSRHHIQLTKMHQRRLKNKKESQNDHDQIARGIPTGKDDASRNIRVEQQEPKTDEPESIQESTDHKIGEPSKQVIKQDEKQNNDNIATNTKKQDFSTNNNQNQYANAQKIYFNTRRPGLRRDACKIKDHLKKFLNNGMSISMKNKKAHCKLCSNKVNFKFDNISNHIMQHKKARNTTESQAGHSKTEQGVKIRKCTISQKDEEELEQIVKDNGLLHNDGVHCVSSGVRLPSSIRSVKKHLEGSQHKMKKKSTIIIPDVKPVDLGKVTSLSFVKTVDFVKKGDYLYVIINGTICINLLSFMLMVARGFIAYCPACNIRMETRQIENHQQLPGHLKRLKESKVLTSLESEYVREVRPNVFHCGYCGIYEKEWKAMDFHLKSNNHREARNVAKWHLVEFQPSISRFNVPRKFDFNSTMKYACAIHIF